MPSSSPLPPPLLPRIVLGLAAVAFAGFGIAFAVQPLRLAATIDIVLPTNTAKTDFIATYGGFQIGFAMFLALCLRRADRLRLGLLASGLAVAGFAIARGLAIAMLGNVDPLLYRVLVFESVCAIAAFWAARYAPRP